MTEPSPSATSAPSATHIRVDASRILGNLHHSEKYVNTSLRFAPTPEVLERAGRNFGPFRIARIFLTLDEYWDFRDGTTRPNYRIGRDPYPDDPRIHAYDRKRSTESDIDYLDYLDHTAAQADALLLCVRRYEHEVRNGLISRTQYEEVLYSGVRFIKTRHPKLRYLEALNESSNDHFGGLDPEAYYEFYRSFYRVVNRVNAEHLPGPELGVGGPACDKKRFHHVGDLLRNFRADPDPAKRMDFVSFHDYASGDRPVRIGELRAQLDEWLEEAGLPVSLPAFITEMGTHEVGGSANQEGLNLRMAAGVPALFEQVRKQHDMIAFPWCLYHDPVVQNWSTQHLPDCRPTPYGMAMTLLGMQKTHELAVESDGLTPDGLGVYTLASADGTGLCLHVWNYRDAPVRVTLKVDRLPADLRGRPVIGYRLDHRHHNVFTDPSHPGDLRGDDGPHPFGDGTALEIGLEPYGHRLWRI